MEHGGRTFRLLPRALSRALRRQRAVAVFVAAGAAALFIGTAPAAAQQQPLTQSPTQAELDSADTDPANWLTDNKGYLGYRFTS